MINTSNEYKQAIKENRIFEADVRIQFTDGTILPVTQAGLFGLGIEDNVSGTSSFDIGAAIINQLTLKLDNVDETYDQYDFDGAKITARIGLHLSESTEWLNKGSYAADPGESSGDVITVKAYDNMKKFDEKYSKSTLKYPATLGSIVRDACTVCGVTLATQSFDQDDYVVQGRPGDEALTFREVLCWVGQIACKWCRCNKDGALELNWYDLEGYEDGTGYFHDIKNLASQNISTDDVVITGIKVVQEVEQEEGTATVEYLSGTEGYVLSIEGNGLIQGQNGQTVASLLGEKLIGLAFRKLSVTHQSDPSIEAGDLAKVTDRKNRVYKTLITGTAFQFGNNQKTECSAETPSRNSAERFSQSTKNYVKLRKQIINEKSAREQAIENLANALANSSGLYITTEEQEDGSSIYYMHNKPTLEESDIIWKITAEAFGISTDGGETYPFGFQVTGEMVAKLLAVEGINASWIRTGVFEVSDKDGNEIMYVDVDTGVVRINAQSLTISGSPVASQQYVRDQVAKLGTLNIILSNDYCSVPVTSDGAIVTGGLSGVDTVVTVLYGTTDITDRVQITITESTGIDGAWSAANKKYTVSSVTTDNAWADFSVTYQGINVVKRFTVAKLYPGEDGEPGKNYQLGSSAVTVRRGKYGVLSPAYVDFTSYYFSGDAVRQPYSGRFAIEESVDGMSWTSRYTSEEDEDAVRCHFYSPMVTSAGLYLSDAQGRFLAALELPEDVIAIRCTLYAAGGTANIIDRQTVSIITDAKSLSAEEYFNLLTDNGRIQGIFMRGDQLFINGEYVQTRGLKAVDENGNTTFYINDKGEVELNVKSLMIAGLGAATQQYAAEQASQALTDSKTYADSVGQNVNNAINQEEIFNRLFANGAVQGISMQKIGSQYYLYINAEYINSGVIKGIKFESGDGNFEVNSSGELISYSSNGTGQCRIYGGYIRLSGASSDTAQNITITKGSYESSLSEEGAQFRSIGSGGVRTIETNITHSAIYSTGDLSIQGTKNRIVKTPDYDSRLQYCYETPSPMFGDIGQGVTDLSGECYVSIDDIFSETVEQGCEYQVFLQEEGQGDLWVDSKEPTFFIVKGTPSLKFAWELKAKQKGYANERLEIYGLSDHENDLDYKSMFVSDVEKFFKEQEGMYSEEIDQLYVP